VIKGAYFEDSAGRRHSIRKLPPAPPRQKLAASLQSIFSIGQPV
jgi:hypothetical protein